jgi:hypothetical protein
MTSVALVVAWAGLMVLGTGIWLGLQALPHRSPRDIARLAGRILTSDGVLPIAAFLLGAVAAIHLLAVELPIGRFGQVVPPTVPFTDVGAVAALVMVVATLCTGYLMPDLNVRRTAVVVAGAIVAYTIPFEVYAWTVAVLWVALAALAIWLIRVDRVGRSTYLAVAAVLAALSAYVAAAIVAPPTRLIVGSALVAPVAIVQTIAALGAVTVAFAIIARARPSRIAERWAWVAAGVTLVYLLSVVAVDLVALQIGGRVVTAELRTQGQVVLSVLWAVLGLSAFVAGLGRRIDDVRHGGLALLALATAKVFLFDLSALDVAYRVISLVALGLLLLVSAWVWQRLRPNGPVEAAAGGIDNP